MYEVIHFFTDLHDDDHPYNIGDVFPRPGIIVTDKRIAELASTANKQGIPLIAQVDPRHDHEEIPKKRTTRKKADR